MTEKLKLVIKREIEKLPKENQTVINAFGWEQISEEIGKKYLLNETELNDFQVQTLLVLIGLTEPEYYTQSIENEVGMSKNEASKISEEVFNKIFTPINDILVENIKKNLKNQNPNTTQTVNFILSGGDYSAFTAPTSEGVGVPISSQSVGKEKAITIPVTPVINKTPTTPTNTLTLADIKANTQKTNIPIKPTKMIDIKSNI